MKKEGDLSNREKETHLLASLKKTNCFTVPNNYFGDLSKNIINQIKIDELAGKDSSFQVPDHYFETLEKKIQTTILVDTSKDLLPSNHSGFLIPNGYSKKSKTEIIGKTIPSKSILRKIISIKFIRYAAAACILLTTSFGIYFNIQRSNNINYKLSKISDETIESYLKQTVEASDVPLIIENLDNKPVFSLDQNQLNADDIDAYLKTTL
jgi:hypothetical protein